MIKIHFRFLVYSIISLKEFNLMNYLIFIKSLTNLRYTNSKNEAILTNYCLVFEAPIPIGLLFLQVISTQQQNYLSLWARLMAFLKPLYPD
jgi:hypothetical protein